MEAERSVTCELSPKMINIGNQESFHVNEHGIFGIINLLIKVIALHVTNTTNADQTIKSGINFQYYYYM